MSDRSPSVKVLTIMMTDIVGSAALQRARGDRDADDILRLHAGIVSDEVVAFGGRVRKSLGDGLLISFPSAVAAVRAAAAIQAALQKHNIADPQRAVEIRIGLHTGEVAEQDGDLYGQAVHAAARVVAVAVGGQILASDEVRKHAELQVDWSFLDSGCSGCEDSPNAGGCTRCRGTTPQRPPGPVLCQPRSRHWWTGTQSGPCCTSSSARPWVGTAG